MKKLRLSFFLLFIFFISSSLKAQLDNNGCVGGNFGIDAGLYSDVIEYGDGTPAVGTNDWFTGTGPGQGVIDESSPSTLQTLLQGGGNPVYTRRMNSEMSSIVNGQIWIDALFARDQFGGSGYDDATSFLSSNKNGADPAVWQGGEGGILGKSDLIDVAGFMMRDGTTLSSDLWFFGLINIAAPGGSAYMDFEFFAEETTFDPATGFSTSGPDMGHTAFEFDASGNIIQTGDFIFNVAMINGGNEPFVEMRIWVSKDDYDNVTPTNFNWGSEFDGAFNGSSYGYASIISNDACGIVNQTGETPTAPPWGTVGTSGNTWSTTYGELSVIELGLNLTSFGIDNAALAGLDPCAFPISSFMVKTRSSASFTASLKDFAGPYSWSLPSIEAKIIGDSLLSCLNPTVTLAADPLRADASFQWLTVDGNITSNDTLNTITVDRPGTYELKTNLPGTNCPIQESFVTVDFDAAKPFFNDLTSTQTVSCSGNDGSIDLTVTGATPNYTFSWSNGATTEDISGLAPGTYTVTVTDAIGCTITDSVTIVSRVTASVSLSATDVDCNGSNTGSIDATVTGQVPFTYSWSNGEETEDIFNLTAGTYTLITTDADGCTDTASVAVNEPSVITLSTTTTDETDPSLNDGTIDLTVNGGTSPYTFDWDNDGLEDPDNDTEDLTGLARGTYTVVVTDANNCTATILAIIYEPEVCNDGIDNDGDGLSDCFDDECTPPIPGAITPSLSPVCVGDVGITYTIDPVAGATGYNWTVPAGATITAGQGTISITVNWISNIGGQICVSSDNVGCPSPAPSCILIDLNDVPPQPGGISN